MAINSPETFSSTAHSPNCNSFFQNARNFTIAGGTFTGNVRNHYWNHCDTGLDILRRYIIPGATFDSAERFPPGRCHPGTREDIINTIYNWISNPTPQNPRQDVLWLYGPAGSGKSAIMQTIAELLRRICRETYGGSFFFSRGTTDRGHAFKLFTTLAYQLAVNIPTIRASIDDALVNDPTLPTKSIEVQFRCLILEPLINDSICTNTPTPILIIDGLDECAESGMQCHILRLITEAVAEYHIPLRFLIASRPEFWIRDLFETEPSFQITKLVSLRDAFNVDSDIEKYLVEGFSQIHRTNRRVMAGIPRPWPPSRIINRFVEESSGQFIYADTVLKYIGRPFTEFHDPLKRLDIITNPNSPHRAAAFDDLDKLYATILGAYPRQHTLKRVLGGLLIDASPKAIEMFLGVESTEISLVLDALSSLINISDPCYSEDIRILDSTFHSPLFEADITFCHLSFREFLEDPNRSGFFSVTGASYLDELLMEMFKTIGTSLTTNYTSNPRETYNISNSAYHSLTRRMAGNLYYTRDIPGLEGLLTDINRKLGQFIAFHPFCNISHVAHLIQDMDWLEFIFNLYESDHIHRDASLQCCISELRANVNVAKIRGVEALLSGNGLKITPTLVYLHYRQFVSMTLSELSSMPGSTLASTLSDLQECRDIIGFTYDQKASALKISSICAIWFPDFLREECVGIGRVIEWRNLQTQLSHLCFASLANDSRTFSMNPRSPMLLSKAVICFQSNVVSEYLSRSELSDILSKRYFRNKYQMEMLNAILDLSNWECLSIGREGFYYLTSSAAIQWINRQLKSPATLELMTEYNGDLIRRMSSMIGKIFRYCFLPAYTSQYFSDLYVYNKGSGHSEILRPKFSPTLQYTGALNGTPFITVDGQLCGLLPRVAEEPMDYLQFNEEMFNKSQAVSLHVPTIHRNEWFSHLAAFLLNVLVKYLHGRHKPQFQDHHRLLDRSTLVKCMSYAQATDQNLAAMRALAYLYPKLNPPWRPPVGFCSAAIDLLSRYDNVAVPPAELDCFRAWLSALRKNEVSAYLPNFEISSIIL